MGLFPDLPDDLSGLTGDELSTLQDEIVVACDAIADGSAELEGADPVASMTEGVEIAEKLRAEDARREQKAADDAVKMEALKARLHAVPDEEPQADAEAEAEAEPEAEEPTEPEVEAAEAVEAETSVTAVESETAPEAIAAATRKAKPVARRSQRATPKPDPQRMVTITAAADIPGFPMGANITTKGELVKAFMARHRGIGRGGTVREERVPVATVYGEYPEDRFLRKGDDDGNATKIKVVQTGAKEQKAEALVAAGGLCAPVEPYYGLKQIATRSRPVRDGMARFGADRGGITFAAPPDFADFADAITVVTADDDASGGSAAIKATLEVSCPQFDTVVIQAIAAQLTFHNMTARAWPEQVENAVANTAAIHARVAETALLDAVATGSTAVTAADVNGMSADLPTQWIKAAAAFRSRHRTAADYTLRVLAPFWTRDAILADMINTQFYRQSTVAEALDQKLAMAGVVASWYLDTPTGGSQIFPAQSAGSLTEFPSEVIWYLFDEGGWLFLDGGTLDLGLVRDSVLNALNEYTIFNESFEGAAFTGIESLQVTSDLCLAGSTGAPDDANTCT